MLRNHVSILVTIFSFLGSTASYTCIHHEVSHKDVPVTRPLHSDTRVKRHSFLPLHIHVHMDDIDRGVHENVHHSIEIALKKVVKFFRETIEVRPTSNPFLLERLNCAQKWQSGDNKDKCSRLKSGPEFCSTKLTDYIIPDAYLSKLEVYNYTDMNPYQVLKKGQGLQQGNFILFVISRSTSWCAESDVQAYGSYCRLDNENRPVAGLLNMCPSKFPKKLFRASHYFNVIMHEVIHILGFSHHLYPKFKTCHSDHGCEIPKKIMHSDAHHIQRLVFPEVVKSMQAHFNCSEPEFGAPLEPHKGNDSTSDDNMYTSHWHPLLMYTSIMTPSLTEESYAVVDNITLALLYSTGWYKVNFKKAQKFLFGKGTGCNFGFEDNCENYNPHWFPSNNASSCDILECAIGKCESIVPYHPCVVHKTKEEGSDDITKNSILNIRLVEYEQHCASVQDEKNMTEPICLVTKCRNMKDIKLLGYSPQNACSSEKKVQGNTIPLNCSNDNDFCSSKKCFCKYNSSVSIFLRMHLKDPTTPAPIEYSNFSSIKPFPVQEMAMPIRNIRNVSLAGWEYLDFCLTTNSSSEMLDLVIGKTQGFLQCSYVHISQDGKERTEVKFIPEIAVPSNVHDGFPTLFTVLAVCGIVVIAILIPFVLRFNSKRRRIRQSVALTYIH